MKHRVQNEPNCLLFAFAMVLDADPNELKQEIGHDGQEEWFPEAKAPFNLRGHHIQELIDCCFNRGYAVTPISTMPAVAPAGFENQAEPAFTNGYAVDRFRSYIIGRRAVLITPGHAVAWDGEKVYDPNGQVAKLDDYIIKEAWIINQII